MAGFARLHPLLLAQLASGQLAHAYIFRGSSALAQTKVLAALLNCQEFPAAGPSAMRPETLRPCGKCPVCLNILSGTYPDCRLIEPERASHRVEGMRTLVAQAMLAPLGGGWKVFILTQAEKMSDEAANTLLKLLEEPPEQTILILITEQPEQLLPTVLSRCQLFVLDQGAAPELEADPLLQREAAALIKSLPGLPVYEVLLKAREREKREDQRGFLLALLTVLHDAALGGTALPMAYPYILRSATMVESSLELIDNNINQKLLIDVVYLRLWQNCER
jgi:hypothetical protein